MVCMIFSFFSFPVNNIMNSLKMGKKQMDDHWFFSPFFCKHHTYSFSNVEKVVSKRAENNGFGSPLLEGEGLGVRSKCKKNREMVL